MLVPIIAGLCYTPIRTENFGKRANLILSSNGCPIMLIRTKEDLPEIEKHIADEKEGLENEKNKDNVDAEHIEIYKQELGRWTQIKKEIETTGTSKEWLI